MLNNNNNNSVSMEYNDVRKSSTEISVGDGGNINSEIVNNNNNNCHMFGGEISFDFSNSNLFHPSNYNFYNNS
jgi:hypothetical protein